MRQKRYREAESHSLAGYNILVRQTSPSVSWLHSAREDLRTIYENLDQKAEAGRFEAQLLAENNSTK